MIELNAGIKFFTISFLPSVEMDVVGYTIHAVHQDDLVNGDFVPSASTQINAGPETTFTYKVSQAGTYFVRAAAYDSFEDTKNINYSSLNWTPLYSVAVSSLDPLDLVAPDTPTGLTLDTGLDTTQAIQDTTFITATWSQPADPTVDLAGYSVQLKKGAEVDYIETAINGKDTLTTKFSGLVANTSYSVRVSAYDKWGNISAYSPWVAITTTKDETIPNDVVLSSVTSAFKNVFISWVASTDTDINYYQIDVATNSGFTVGLRSFNVTGTSLTVDAVSGSTYYVRAKAVDFSGNVSVNYSNVLNTTAALVSGIDIAALTLTASNIANGEIDLGGSKITGLLANANLAQITDATKIADSLIITSKIADAAILSTKLAAGAVDNTKIADGAISAAKVAASAIDATKTSIAAINSSTGNLNAGTVSASNLVANAVTATAIAASAVTAAKLSVAAIDPASGNLAANSVTAGTIAAGTIVAADIAADTITASNIAAGAIGATEIAAGAITAGKIAAGAIVAADIAADTITASNIAAGAITAAELSTNSVVAGKIAANTLTVGDGVMANAYITSALIANLAVGSAQIQDAAITNAKIGALAVGSAQIQDAAITNAKIGTLAVNTSNIVDAAISTAKIANLAVDVGKIADATITDAKIANATITSAKINDLSAGKITTGTLAATSVIAVGDDRVKIDGTNKRITVNDGTYDRVILGNTGAGSYGLVINNAAGQSIFHTDGNIDGTKIANLAVTGSVAVGGSVTIGGATLTFTAPNPAGIGAVAVDLSNAPTSILNSSVTADTLSVVKTDASNAPSSILNSSISISSTGVLSGGGGGTVTLSGLGYTIPTYNLITGGPPVTADNTSSILSNESGQVGTLTLNAALTINSLLTISGSAAGITSGLASYSSDGTGFWISKDTSNSRMRVGTVSGGVLTNGFVWDGTAFKVRGALNADDMTAGTLNVDDLVAPNSIINPESAYTPDAVIITTEADIQSVTIVATGKPILLTVSFQQLGGTSAQLRLKRTTSGVTTTLLGPNSQDGTHAGFVSFSIMDSPAAGTHIYSITGTNISVQYRSLVAIELKTSSLS